ncbi:uncharacterized protein LOC110704234 [Chenopodium quinoa]|uniref:uncharacterized protein LOC110704234 n=1 Tax=Chenopodium quinoa TaxID=63459 RepID=UPI000B77338C|nr:uncharacterized protein LOC110704234 [Chenopodium quinoa]
MSSDESSNSSNSSSNKKNSQTQRYERRRQANRLVNRMMDEFFMSNPIELFRRRFRMNKHIFLRIKQTLEERHPFFQQRQDATGRFGASGLQKCTAAMRLIVYGTSADSVDDYIRISASLARDSLQHFVEGIVSYFSDEYLRNPNE